MRTIYKYPLDINDRVTVSMPKASPVLSIQVQHMQPCIWALVDTDCEPEDRTFAVFGTGHPVPDDVAGDDHLATVQVGALVFHVFEVRAAFIKCGHYGCKNETVAGSLHCCEPDCAVVR